MDIDEKQKQRKDIRSEFIATDATQFARGERANSRDLWDSFNKVLAYWQDQKSQDEYLIGFSQGKQHTKAELELYAAKGKTPIVANKMKPSERRILGHFSSSMFDAEWQAVDDGPADATQAEIRNKLYLWECAQQQFKYKDPDLIRQAWITGTAYMEVFPELMPSKMASIKSQKLNRFAVYWDPSSRQPITRDDAQFCDVLGWYTLEDLLEAFPDQYDNLMNALYNRDLGNKGWETDNRAADTDIMTKNEKHGKFRVLERYIRIKQTIWTAWTKSGMAEQWDNSHMEGHRERVEMYGSQNIQVTQKEILWLVVALDDSSMEGYLYSGPYHSQPVNPSNGRIIWPILELACETLDGETSGFVQHEVDPQKLLNMSLANVADSARHASAAGKLINSKAFKDQKTAGDFAKYGADSNRSFEVKDEFWGRAVAEIPRGQVNMDNHKILEYASVLFEEISSTPPSMQGVTEAGASGVKLQTLIEQALAQILPFVDNYRLFCERRALLLCEYWRQHYTEERRLRVLGKNGKEEELVINQPQANGSYYGEVQKMNDLSVGYYDVTLKDGIKSPSYRLKLQQQLTSLAQAPMIGQDPVLGAILAMAFAETSDLPPHIKEMISGRCKTIVEQSQQQQAQGQAEQITAQAEQQAQQITTQAQEQAQMTTTAAKAQADKTAAETALKKIQAEIQILEQKAQQLNESLTNDLDNEIAEIEKGLTNPEPNYISMEQNPVATF